MTAKTLDDLLALVLARLVRGQTHVPTSRGLTTEMTGVLLKLANPRARLSHSETKGHVFSCLGELLWYLAKSDRLDFISYYLPRYEEDSTDKKTLFGAYGPRLFAQDGNDQIANVIDILRSGPMTRRAVIQLFDAKDIAHRQKEIPCTCTLQFLLRKGKLHMITNMRSNDAFRGLPHDVFAFTMLQEIVARALDADVGIYKHAVGSLHIYHDDYRRIRKYLGEGLQPTTKPMPAMPAGDPWPAIAMVLKAEKRIRKGKAISLMPGLNSYWADLVRLLQIFYASKAKDEVAVRRLKRQMVCPIYYTHIRRKERTRGVPITSEQLSMPFPEGQIHDSPTVQSDDSNPTITH